MLYSETLAGEVDEEMLEKVVRSLRRQDNLSFLLCSEGGDLDIGLAIYDLLRLHPKRVTITVGGGASSAAALLLQAADHRVMLPNSYLMIHQSSLSIDSTKKDEVKATLRMMERQDEKMHDILLSSIQAKHQGYSWTKLVRSMKGDHYLWADQAVSLGLADEVLAHD